MNGIDFKNLPSDPKTSQKIIDKSFEQNKINQQLGWLGKFFGASDFVKVNIAGLCIFILIIAGIIYTACVLVADVSNNPKAIGIVEFWGIISPIITLSLGFIFGKNDNKQQN